MAKLWGRYRYLPYIPCVHTGIAFSILNIFSKMEDLKDIRSTLPARTPKLQLAAEQPLIGECQILSKKDTTCQGAKRKPQQDGRRGEITFRIKPHTLQRLCKGSNKPCAHQDPEIHRDWDRTVFECLLQRYGSAVDCCWGRGSGCSRPGYGISPLGGGHH